MSPWTPARFSGQERPSLVLGGLVVVKFVISPRTISEPFWDGVLCGLEEAAAQAEALRARLFALEGLRGSADYNTGSITWTAAACLYTLALGYQARRVIEVGTFIGKSTVAMASAMDDRGAPGEIYTCDMSNHLTLPWDGKTRIQQFPGASSTAMLSKLEGEFDFAFIDGRFERADLEHFNRLTTPDTIVALDDFEGIEKGVVNLSKLRELEKFRNHMLIYPPSAAVLAKHGLAGHTTTAVLLPMSRITFGSQG